MRLMFVSSITTGGSGRSQRELATELVSRGHEVRFLVDDERPARITRWWYEHLSDLSVKLDRRPGAGLVRRLRDRPGRRTERIEIGGLGHVVTPVPQNAFLAMVDSFKPDVVVGNSVDRWAWRRILGHCRGVTPTILYVREDNSIDHLSVDELPDAVVANAESLARSVRKRGIACEVIPSVINTSVTATTSTRQVALAINPIGSRGVDVVWKIAEQLPDIPFVLQESWTLTAEQLALIEDHIADLSNIELRRAKPPGPELYGDTKVLLAPYRGGDRPRVIAEVQANAIPVIAGDMPGLREATGNGGVTVALEDVDHWVAALDRIWRDEVYYGELCRAAHQHSQRPEIAPGNLADRFLIIVESIVVAPLND